MAVDAQNIHLPSSGPPHLCSNPHDQSSSPSSNSSQIINPLAQTQLHEIERYIIQQYEGLRFNILEQRKRYLAAIINHLETKFNDTLFQKDQDIAEAKNRTAQLELILHRAETEHQQWRNIALVRETQSIHLNNTLQQMLSHRQRRNEELDSHGVFDVDNDDDAESCCDVENKKIKAKGVCRACGVRDACVVLLPCRHLCCCVGCELRIDSCLVCRCLKQNAVQVLLL